MDKLQVGLAVVGAIAIGLPALLRAVLAILRAIPGEQFEPAVEKVIVVADKAAELVLKLYPGSK